MSQLLSQTLDFIGQGEFSEDRDSHDPETASSSGAFHVPTQLLAIPSTRSIYCLDSGLPLGARISMGISGDVFEDLPAREEQPSATFENSRNLASSSCRRNET